MSEEFEDPGFAIACDVCEKTMEEPGATITEPPDENMKARIYNVCKKCFKHVIKPILPEPEQEW